MRMILVSGFVVLLYVSFVFQTLSSFCTLFKNEKQKIQQKKYLSEAINIVLEDMQFLCNEENDSLEIISIIEQKNSNSIQTVFLEDVSTGIFPELLSKKIISSIEIKELLEKEPSCFTQYGWIFPKYAEKSFLEDVLCDFEVQSFEELFPLCNDFPKFNVFFMSEDFMEAVLRLCKIQSPKEKAKLIFENAQYSSFCKRDLKDILCVSEEHCVFDFIGFKTSFWKITVKSSFGNVESIIASIPEKNKKQISKYSCIEKNFF